MKAACPECKKPLNQDEPAVEIIVGPWQVDDPGEQEYVDPQGGSSLHRACFEKRHGKVRMDWKAQRSKKAKG